MKIESGENYLEIEISLEKDKDLPNYGDAYLVVSVVSNGYSGRNDLWVSSEEFSMFCSSLIALEESRKGSAMLTSISPGELEIEVYSTDSRGHMAVRGSTGYSVLSGENSFNHSVTFGFSFEPDQLVRLSKQLNGLVSV